MLRFRPVNLTILRKIIWPTNGRGFCCQEEKEKDLIRFNYHPDCEKHINQHITLELYAGYAYMVMAFHFDDYKVALPGFHKQFLIWSQEEFEHAHKLMYFQNKRGGKLTYQSLEAPPACQFTPEKAVSLAIDLEKKVTKSFDELHEKATKHSDQHLCDFIEGEFLTEQFEAIRELGDLYTQVQRVGSAEGLFVLDQAILEQLQHQHANKHD